MRPNKTNSMILAQILSLEGWPLKLIGQIYTPRKSLSVFKIYVRFSCPIVNRQAQSCILYNPDNKARCMDAKKVRSFYLFWLTAWRNKKCFLRIAFPAIIEIIIKPQKSSEVK